MRDRHRLSIIALLGLIVGLAFQGTPGLFDPSEGRYAEVAREMVESGDYLRPTLDYQPHWTKPPLAYWTIAAGIELFGANAWGARSFNAIAFLLATLTVAGIGSRLWDRRTGFLAALVYVSSPLPALGAAVLTSDTVLALCELLAVFAYVSAYRSDSRSAAARWTRVMWLGFGLGFFTKGPPALLPLAAIVVFHWRGRAGAARFRLIDALGAATFIVTAFWWYVVVSIKTPGLASYFVNDEILKRNFTGHFHRNSQWYGPFVVYGPVLLVCLGVWVGHAARAAARAIRAGRTRSVLPWGAPGTPRFLLVLWFTLPLVILSLSKSRLPLYLIPLHAPIALACAAGIVRTLSPRSLTRTAVAAVILCLALKAAMPFVNQKQNARLLWAAATSVGGDAARYVIVNEEHRYGLQFYFEGNMERATLGKKQPWADDDVASLARKVSSDKEPATVVFMADGGAAEGVEKELKRAGVEFARMDAHGHHLIVTAPVLHR